ncbi:hypothetical protein CN514_04130 [Bacillus sp. AFS001701]|uniref:recombinase family protein n=1 Tax=Bacillus sp. AFS001701 TaxID=2033480 RepID=UPI000BF2EC34|nr:recombinase family protein [Bacillus sp. AFS001701]PET75426.1 hypothetical protein CN514_04130 [Bacillus sp. AFS001701]
MKKAVAYYRKSIEREAEKSIERQKEEVRMYAAENNIEIIEEFSEVASSATIEREEFKKMMDMFKERTDVDYILIHRFDRISRDPMQMGYIFTMLDESYKVKTRPHSITEDNDFGNDPTKLMMVLMKSYGAAIERLAIVDRLQGARKRKASKGGFIGGTPPAGYISVPGTGKLEINEDEVSLVKTVFELREKKLSMNKIAAKLNELGFKSRKGLKFHAQTVHRIIKHEKLYKGEYEDPGILNT